MSSDAKTRWKRPRKRPRRFLGVQKQCLTPVDPDCDDGLTLPSASRRKIEPGYNAPEGVTSGTSSVLLRPRPTGSASGVKPGSSEGDWVLSGMRIIPCDSLVSVLGMLRHCDKKSVSVSETCVRGLVTRIMAKCECGWFQYLTESYSSSHLALNTQAVLGM